MSGEATKHAYEAKARSADTFGRMFWTARHHHMVSDGPVSLGCPGEAIMPGELFSPGSPPVPSS